MQNEKDLVSFENNFFSSVVDPNTLNLDPDPEFRPNLDLDPGLGYQFKIILKKDNLLQKHIFCLTIGA